MRNDLRGPTTADRCLEGQMTTTSNRSGDGEPGEFRLTGRHVLAILLAVFAVVAGVNIFMMWNAIGSFPGLVTESSYRDSQHFNAEIAAARAQAELGWQVDATAVRAPDGRVTVRVDASDAKGAPVSGVSFRATLQHPANRSFDHLVPLVAVAGATGRFEGTIADVAPGKWGLVIEGDGAHGRVFLSQNSLLFE